MKELFAQQASLAFGPVESARVSSMSADYSRILFVVVFVGNGVPELGQTATNCMPHGRVLIY